MINETIAARLGTEQPENNPVLEGTYPPHAERPRPLADAQGEPMLSLVVQALVAGMKMPSPASIEAQRERSVLDAGASYPAIDPERLAEYQQRGRRLQGRATAEGLGQAGKAVGRAVARGLAELGRWLTRALQPAPSHVTDERLRAYGHTAGYRGMLDVPRDYAERVAQFYGRGL